LRAERLATVATLPKNDFMGSGFSTISRAEAKESIEKMRKKTQQLIRKPGAARAFLIKHGFITKSGRLTKQYR
jgi:hypothetical protein